jgi:hypothetical protein
MMDDVNRDQRRIAPGLKDIEELGEPKPSRSKP